MSSGSDGVIEHLLFYIALSGTHGLGALDFVKCVSDFHKHDLVSDSKDPEIEDLFFSAKPPKKRINLDSDYLNSIWSWISSHKDVSISTGSAGADQTEQDIAPSQRAFLLGHANARLVTTEDRIWQAITDHGVDWKRVPKSEFQCLCVVAAHGPAGVLQPDVVRITKQDKRSVPGRTDKLAEKGYITKEACIGGGSKTSLLRLKKFAQDPGSSLSNVIPTNSARIKHPDNVASVVRYDEWYDAIIKTLEEYNGLAPTDAIREAAGVVGARPLNRSFLRSMKRLETRGMCKIVRAPGPNYTKPTQSQREKGETERLYKSLKLLRKPNAGDRDVFIADLKKHSAYMNVAGRDGKNDEDDSDPDGDGEEEILDIAAPVPDTPWPETSSTPYWTPDLNCSNVIHDVVSSFGSKGVSSMDLCAVIGGPTWRRPFDEAMGHLTDEWHVSQPAYLRHLALVRDTYINRSITHYMFRTIPNYQKAANAGLASWSYIFSNPGIKDAVKKRPDLDEWGFPVIDQDELLDSRLPATACAQAGVDQITIKRYTSEARHALADMGGDMEVEKSESQIHRRRSSAGTTPRTPKKRLRPSNNNLAVKQPKSKRQKTSEIDIPQADISQADISQADISTSTIIAQDQVSGQAAEETVPSNAPISTPLKTPVDGISTDRDSRTSSGMSQFRVNTLQDGIKVAESSGEDEHSAQSRNGPTQKGPELGTETAITNTSFPIKPMRKSQAPHSQASKAAAVSSIADPSDETSHKAPTGTVHGAAFRSINTPDIAFSTEVIQTTSPMDTPTPPTIARRFDPSLQLDGTPTSATLTKRAKWTRRYEELKDSWRLRVTARAKQHLYLEELRRLDKVPECATGVSSDIHDDTSTKATASGGADTIHTSSRGSDLSQNTAAGPPHAETGTFDLEVSANTPRHPPTFEEMDIPEQRLRTAVIDLQMMSHAGVYINEPRAIMLHRDFTTRRGRPKEGLIAVFKSVRLKQLGWFNADPMVPSKRLRETVPSMFDDTAATTSGGSKDPFDGPKRKRRRTEKQMASDGAAQTGAEITAHEGISHSGLGSNPPQPVTNEASNHTSATSQEYNRKSIGEVTDRSDVASIAADTTQPREDVTAIEIEPAFEFQEGAVAQDDSGQSVKIDARRRNQSQEISTRVLEQPVTAQVVHADPSTALPSSTSSTRRDTHKSGQEQQQEESSTRSLEVGNRKGIRVVPTGTKHPEEPQEGAGAQVASLVEPSSHAKVAPRATDDSISEVEGRDITPQTQTPSRPYNAGMNMWEVINKQATAGAVGGSRPPRTIPQRKGISRNTGQVEFQRAKIIMSILQKCGGVFPGRHEMFYPFASFWYQRYGQVPDRKTLERSLTGLLLVKKIKKVDFSFEDKDGNMSYNQLLIDAQADPESNKAKEVMSKVKEVHPSLYIPPEIPLSKAIRYRIRQRQRTTTDGRVSMLKVPAFFRNDHSAVTQPSVEPPFLGRIEKEIKETAEKRRKKREAEERRYVRQQRQIDGPDDGRTDRATAREAAQRETVGLDAEVMEWTNEFQLTNYEHQPKAATVDRGPHNRARLGKRIRFRPPWQDEPARGPSLGTLKDSRERRAVQRAEFEHHQSMEREASRLRQAAELDAFMREQQAAGTDAWQRQTGGETGQTKVGAYGGRTLDQIATEDPRFGISSLPEIQPGVVMFINYGPDFYDESYDEEVILSLMDPDQSFHAATGTFATDATKVVSGRTHFWQLADVKLAGPAQTELTLDGILEHTGNLESSVFPTDYDDEEGASFEREVARVQYWEGQVRDGAKQSVSSNGFINHSVPKNFTAVRTDAPAHHSRHVTMLPRLARTSRAPTSSRLQTRLLSAYDPPARPSTDSMLPRKLTLEYAQAPMDSPYLDTTHVSEAVERPSRGLPQEPWRKIYQLPAPDEQPMMFAPRRSNTIKTGFALEKQTMKDPMTAKEEERLMYAVAVVTTIAGGLQQTSRCTNYSAVNHAMHFKFDGSYCRQHWGLIKSKHGLFVVQLQQRFRVAFLDAFEKDELPDLNLAIPEKTDWAALVDWAQWRLDRELREDNELPSTREEMDLEYSIEEPSKYEPKKDDFYNVGTSTVRKEDMINSYAYFDILPPILTSMVSEAPSMLLQSWVRADVLTPEEVYNAPTANRKLTMFGNAPLQKALDTMLGQKHIRGATKNRYSAGRNYVISTALSTSYPLPWQWTMDLFLEAAKFKSELDDCFSKVDAEGERILRLNEDQSNAQAMVVINMAENGRLDLDVELPPIDPGFELPWPKLTKWGFTEGSYKSMNMDRGRLTFPVAISPTEVYTFSERQSGCYPSLADGRDDVNGSLNESPADKQKVLAQINDARLLNRPIRVLPVPLSVRYDADEVAAADCAHRLPYWTDIHGHLMKGHLRQMVMIVLYMLHSRPGMDAKEMSKALKDKIWAWELAVLCSWLGEVGALERDEDVVAADHKAARDGNADEMAKWRLAEWWWLAGEAVEAQMGEEALQPVKVDKRKTRRKRASEAN
ncbi:hypothetical protein CAC42_6024 [Sphaceloma murrayae]|uniref:Uncharacterized protein n=1 Tax=Sphaceloma murrayae TaxID=2082308 RepID=A0A2K1QV90_9PEZI|nr:hypothetical protein CAC42_6024 [Sphaceloma murrayae]